MKEMLTKSIKAMLSGPITEITLLFPSLFLLQLMKRLNEIDLSTKEIKLITDKVKEKKSCNFLVFGLGNDSVFWHKLNFGGKTLFLEESEWWLAKVQEKNPNLLANIIGYNTVRTQWRELLSSPMQLEIEDLPSEVRNDSWDVILVDAPTGSSDSCPGRMKSIFLASQLISPNCSIFVHDCDREIEKVYCDEFLGKHPLFDSYCEVNKLRMYKFKQL